jgi:UDP-N-acetylmuramyl tripeptide synthase
VRYRLAIFAGLIARRLLRLRGGGSAVPGRIVLAIAPDFLQRAVSRLPQGLVFVSGSNGKSTTTNMLSGILREHGLDVFTNPSGGNLPQGIAAAMLADIPWDGYIRADVGVLEVDEAYGVGLAKLLKPRGVLLLNVQIDQLNRFYEPGRVAQMLRTVAASATRLLVVNRDDDSVRHIAQDLGATVPEIVTFDAAPSVVEAAPHGLANVTESDGGAAAPVPDARVRVESLSEREAAIAVDGVPFRVELPARGLHYAVDAAGAIATAVALLGDAFRPEAAAAAMSSLRTVYGRGETIEVDGQRIEIIMMKNPPSLQLNLDYLAEPPEQLFMAVDEGTPDPSWIYDTDLSALSRVSVLSGTKAWQLATRFAYAGIPVDGVIPDLDRALRAFLALPARAGAVKTMIVNYEQMMLIRKQLGFLDLEGAA